MASADKAPEPLKYQTWVLKVLIHCEGCKRKVRRVLRSIEGVYITTVDSQQHKVTVIGDVDAAVLIKKLAKNGKHADLLPATPLPDKNKEEKVKIEKSENDVPATTVGNNAMENEKDGKNNTTTKTVEPAAGNKDATEQPANSNAKSPKPKEMDPPKPEAETSAAKGGGKGKPKKKKAPKESNGNSEERKPPTCVLPLDAHVPPPSSATSYCTVYPSLSYGYCAAPPCCSYSPHLNGGWYYYGPREDSGAPAACRVM